MKKSLMFSVLMLFWIVSVSAQPNIIANPSFEIGSIPQGQNQVPYATNWYIGCALVYNSNLNLTMPGSPDLFDVRSGACEYGVPANKWTTLNERTGQNRYVGFNGGSYVSTPNGIIACYGESVMGTLTQPLVSNCNYWTSFYAAATIGYSLNCPGPGVLTIPNPSYNGIEVVLRKDNLCNIEKVVFITTGITNNNWTYFGGGFSLTPEEAAIGFNRIEYRIQLYPLNYYPPNNYSHSILLDDVALVRTNTPISSDFVLKGTIPSGNTTTFMVEADMQPLPSGGSFYWEISEVDKNGNVISGTTLTNPSSWWSQPLLLKNTFPGYCCNSNITIGDGIFYQNHYYRVTRGTWGPCADWTSTSKIAYMKSGGDNESQDKFQKQIVFLADSNYRFDINKIERIINQTQPQTEISNRYKADILSSDDFIIYPNPCSEILSVKYSGLTNIGRVKINLLNSMGTDTGISLDCDFEESMKTINIRILPTGVYIVQIVLNDLTINKKLIIEK